MIAVIGLEPANAIYYYKMIGVQRSKPEEKKVKETRPTRDVNKMTYKEICDAVVIEKKSKR